MHANARLTVHGRLLLVERISAGRPVAHVASEMGVSRATAHKWWKRFCDEGHGGLADRSSKPLSCPHRTKASVESRIERLRKKEKLGPARIGATLGVAPSTVHAVLVRLRMNRLSWMDRPTGAVIRRYEHHSAGDLVHVDIKKLGKIPAGGGWRAHGRGKGAPRSRAGYAFVHSAVDDHSRLAYSEVLENERAETTASFWDRAEVFLRSHGVVVQRVLTDNGSAYRSAEFAESLAITKIKHSFIRPYRPQADGKVERFNRTLLEEWACAHQSCR